MSSVYSLLLVHLLLSPLYSCKPTSSETDRYKPFILAFNSAFEALHRLEIPRLVKPSTLDILFHQNNPSLITTVHDGDLWACKPDIVLVSHQDVQDAYKSGDPGQWPDFAFKTACDSPKEPFTWSHLLSCLEFKLRKKSLVPPPVFYNIYEILEITPMPAPLDAFDEIGLWTVTGDTSDIADDSEFSTENPDRIHPTLQSALYAAERLSHGIWVNHAINLVVIGT